MALKCGIVGLPNVGKSTLFNCLSSAKAQSANFPFCTIEPNLGVITVPDERLNKLAEIVHPGRIVPATCEIVDIAGLVKGASKGEGLGNSTTTISFVRAVWLLILLLIRKLSTQSFSSKTLKPSTHNYQSSRRWLQQATKTQNSW